MDKKEYSQRREHQRTKVSILQENSEFVEPNLAGAPDPASMWNQIKLVR